MYTAKIVFATVCDAHQMSDNELKRFASFERKITIGKVTDACLLVAVAPPEKRSIAPFNAFVPHRAWIVNKVKRGNSMYRAGRRARNLTVTFELGAEVPVLPEMREIPKLRYGMSVAIREIEV